MEDNRDWLVFIICSISIMIGLIGVFIIYINCGVEVGYWFVTIFNITFILFWIIMIVIDKNNKKFNKWLNNKKIKHEKRR